MRRSSEQLPAGASLLVLAGAAAVVAGGLVGLVVVGSAPAGRRAAAGPQAPAHEVCPQGGLNWAVTQFETRVDPLNPRNVSVVEAGTVRDDAAGNISLQLVQNSVSATPAQGSTTYPVYLRLDNDDLYPGQVAHFSGSSAEVGVDTVTRGPISYQASWDNPSFGGCALPAHLGSP
ncbi:hypothetical protein K6U06_20935 [Acidiferrimicrobium sp. IK]|uniref:hypothetical protein n=1 Tax=Acidiferrimicrobium sp. IK TaxID=2871700 RepID=UPI0021CB087C|nr:hypothetical protein [Acidiferrimicrobium sp. IK]MCU4186844.1 hypothetical protein [Acidiferrimicrobium sp. IK]